MNIWIIVAIYWVIAVAAVYVNGAYKKKKKRHLNAILKAFGATREIPVWKKIVSHVVTVLLVPPLAPIGLLVFLIDRIKKQVEKKRKEKQEKDMQKILTRIDLAPPIDTYCNASVALMNAVVYGRFDVFEKMLDDDVQIIQDGQETIKGKKAAVQFWRKWKTEYVDAIDLDAFERIFVDVDFEVVKSDDDSRACVKLMITQKIVKFEIKDGRVVKMLLVNTPLG